MRIIETVNQEMEGHRGEGARLSFTYQRRERTAIEEAGHEGDNIGGSAGSDVGGRDGGVVSHGDGRGNDGTAGTATATADASADSDDTGSADACGVGGSGEDRYVRGMEGEDTESGC